MEPQCLRRIHPQQPVSTPRAALGGCLLWPNPPMPRHPHTSICQNPIPVQNSHPLQILQVEAAVAVDVPTPTSRCTTRKFLCHCIADTVLTKRLACPDQLQIQRRCRSLGLLLLAQCVRLLITVRLVIKTTIEIALWNRTLLKLCFSCPVLDIRAITQAPSIPNVNEIYFRAAMIPEARPLECPIVKTLKSVIPVVGLCKFQTIKGLV